MSVPWNAWALEQISKERPELTLKPVPHIDWVVVEFLKEHDVEARPVSFNDRSAGEIAMGGLMGAMGTFESAAWHGLKGQEKAVKAQEWTSWKQWALSHADWAAFKEAHIGEAKRHNDQVERQLCDPAFVEEWRKRLNPTASGGNGVSSFPLVLLGVSAWILTVVTMIYAFDANNAKKDQRSHHQPAVPERSSFS